MAVTVVDNADAGYSEPAGSWSLDAASGYGGSLRYILSGALASARWELTGLTASSTVGVSWTWVEFSNRSTVVPWTIYDSDGTTPLATGSVNQESAPTADHVENDGSNDFDFENSDSVTISGTSVYFEITNIGADDYIIADAVRFDVTAPGGGAAQVTALSLMGTPGKPQTFTAKTPAGPSGANFSWWAWSTFGQPL